MSFCNSFKLLMMLLHVMVKQCVLVWGDHTKEQNCWLREYACSRLQQFLPTVFQLLLQVPSLQQCRRVVVSPRLPQHAKMIDRFSRFGACEVYSCRNFIFIFLLINEMK